MRIRFVEDLDPRLSVSFRKMIFLRNLMVSLEPPDQYNLTPLNSEILLSPKKKGKHMKCKVEILT